MSQEQFGPELPLREFHKARDACVKMLLTIAQKCPGSAVAMTVADPNAMKGEKLHYNVELPGLASEQIEHLLGHWSSLEELQEAGKRYREETPKLEQFFDKAAGRYRLFAGLDLDDFTDKSHDNGTLTRLVKVIQKSDHVDPSLKGFLNTHLESVSGNSLWFDRAKNPGLEAVGYMVFSFLRPEGEQMPIAGGENIKTVFEMEPSKSGIAKVLSHKDFGVKGYDLMAELILATQQLSDDDLRLVFRPHADVLLFKKVVDTLNKDIQVQR